MDFFFVPFIVFIAVPPLALIPSVLFGVTFRRHRSELSRLGAVSLVASALSWFGYTLYECVIWVWTLGLAKVIRFDLLIWAPLLYITSFFGLLACWRARYTRRKGSRLAVSPAQVRGVSSSPGQSRACSWPVGRGCALPSRRCN